MGMTAGVFSWKFWCKWHEAPCFWEDGHFFDKILAWEWNVFREWTFFYKMAWEHLLFSWKIGKKWHPIDFFVLYHGVVFYRIHVFDQIWVRQQWVFHDKFEKNYMKAPCFLESWCFLTKYGHESSVLSWEIGKKGQPIDFIGP